MKILPLLLATVLPATLCRADLTIVQQIKQGSDASAKEMTVTTKFKDDFARIDISPQMATIVNLKTGDATSLIIPQKAAMKVTSEMVQEMKKAASPNGEATKIEPPKPTGKKDTINGFACEEYTTTVQGKTVNLWITKDAPEAEKAVAKLSSLSAGNDPLSAALSQENMPGFPVRAEIEVPQIGKLTATVVTLNTNPVDASEFVVPADFKEMALPAGMGSGGR